MTTILVADDYEPMVDLYKTWLKDKYEIVEACNCQEVVAKYKECCPDLVITEAELPKGSGNMVVQKIREVDHKANIVVATAYQHTEDEQGAPVMRKSFKREAFLDMVEERLERK